MDHGLRYRGIIPAPETELQKKRSEQLVQELRRGAEKFLKVDRYRSLLLLPPFVRNNEVARLMTAYEKATSQELPTLEAEYARLLPQNYPGK